VDRFLPVHEGDGLKGQVFGVDLVLEDVGQGGGQFVVVEGGRFGFGGGVDDEEPESSIDGFTVPEAGRFFDPAAAVHDVEGQGLEFGPELGGPLVIDRLELRRKEGRQEEKDYSEKGQKSAFVG